MLGWSGSGGVLRLDLTDHLPHMAGFALAGFENGEALAVGTPLDDVDVYAACAPGVHCGMRRLVKINSSGSDEGGAVVINDVDIGIAVDLKDGAHGIHGPISGGAADLAVFERTARSILRAVLQVIALGVGEGGGSNVVNDVSGLSGLGIRLCGCGFVQLDFSGKGERSECGQSNQGMFDQ